MIIQVGVVERRRERRTPRGPPVESCLIAGSSPAPDPARRARELFDAHRDAICRRTDRLLGGLIAFQWVVAVELAVTLTPFVGSSGAGRGHSAAWTAALAGGAI